MLNRAKGHSNVKLTWDKTDNKRSEMLLDSFKKVDDDDEDFGHLVADSDEESHEDDEDEEKLEKYRGMLLDGGSSI